MVVRPHGGVAKSRRAGRFRVGVVVAVVRSALSALAVGVLPETAGAAPVASAVYVSNYAANSVTAYPTTANGDVAPSVTLNSSSPSTPWGSAVDSAGDLWVANYSGNTIVEYTPARDQRISLPAVTISGNISYLDEPTGLAFDPTGDLWVVNSGSDELLEYTPAEVAASGSPTRLSLFRPRPTALTSPGVGFRLRRRPMGGQRGERHRGRVHARRAGRQRSAHPGCHYFGHGRQPARTGCPALQRLG